jgi:hypothetical protein
VSSTAFSACFRITSRPAAPAASNLNCSFCRLSRVTGKFPNPRVPPGRYPGLQAASAANSTAASRTAPPVVDFLSFKFLHHTPGPSLDARPGACSPGAPQGRAAAAAGPGRRRAGRSRAVPIPGRTPEFNGILCPWTGPGSGKMVHTSTYQYIMVQHGTGQYENSSFAQGSMYQHIPVQAFNKTCGFPTNTERVRRDKIKVVQLLCIGYNVTMAIFKTTQV